MKLKDVLLFDIVLCSVTLCNCRNRSSAYSTFSINSTFSQAPRRRAGALRLGLFSLVVEFTVEVFVWYMSRALYITRLAAIVHVVLERDSLFYLATDRVITKVQDLSDLSY